MRNIVPLILVIWLIIPSCDIEPCKDVVCVNGQALEDGEDCFCLCDFGWDGVDCTIENKCQTQNVICLNGGNCDSETGTCICVPGFEGDSCQILSRNRFLETAEAESNWDAQDTCLTATVSYNATIKSGPNSRSLEIFNLRDLGTTESVFVTVNAYTFQQNITVTIGAVEVSDFNGELSQDTDTIRVSYTANEVGCSGTWIRL